MFQALKYGAKLCLFFSACAVLSALLLLTLMDANRLKPAIEEIITHYTSQPVEIRGKIKIGLIPWARLSLQNVLVKSPPEFADHPLAVIGRLEVSVNVWPLLFQDSLQIRKLSLQNADIHLIKNEKGIKNWQPEVSPAPEQPLQTLLVPHPAYPLGIDIRQLEIRNTHFRLEDQKDPSLFEIQGLSLRAAPVFLPEPPILLDPPRYTMTRLLKVKGRFEANELTAADRTLRSLKGNFENHQGLFTLAPFTFSFYEGDSSANLQVDWRGNEPVYQVTLSILGTHEVKKIYDKIPFTAQSSDLTLTASTQGDNSDDILRTLTLSGNFLLRDGQFDLLNLPELLTEANKFLTSGKVQSPVTSSEVTPFNRFSSNISMKIGQIQFDNAAVYSDVFTLTGYGNINLKDLTQLYHLQLDVVDHRLYRIPSALRSILRKELNGRLPILIHGPLKSPMVDLDYELIDIQKLVLGAPVADLLNSMDSHILEDKFYELRQKIKDFLRTAQRSDN